MKLIGVEVKKVTWNARKLDSEGGIKTPATTTITLEVPADAADEIQVMKSLLDYAPAGGCDWDVTPQRRMA